MKKTIGKALIILGGLGILSGVYGIYKQIFCTRKNLPDFPACGVMPNEILIGIIAIPTLVIGLTFIVREKNNLKNKK